MAQNSNQIRLIKDKQVGEKLSVSRSTVWQMSKHVPGFPKPIPLSSNATRWLEHEIDEYVETRAKLRVTAAKSF